MKYARTLAGIFTLLFFFVLTTTAQDSKKEAQLRTVHGVVSDKSENPLPNSVVFLKNLRTNAVRSNFADTEGNYRFSGLDPNADYRMLTMRFTPNSREQNRRCAMCPLSTTARKW